MMVSGGGDNLQRALVNSLANNEKLVDARQLFARAMHRENVRPSKPVVEVTVAAEPPKPKPLLLPTDLREKLTAARGDVVLAKWEGESVVFYLRKYDAAKQLFSCIVSVGNQHYMCFLPLQTVRQMHAAGGLVRAEDFDPMPVAELQRRLDAHSFKVIQANNLPLFN
jgi:pentatricopeptide repeat protein